MSSVCKFVHIFVHNLEHKNMKHILSFAIGLIIGLSIMMYNNYNIRKSSIISIHEWRSLFFQSIKENYRAIELLHIKISKTPKKIINH